jgi:hypothetical protein
MGSRGPLVAVLALVAAVYAPVSSAWFCGYDDFHDLARAAYEFAPDPRRVFTRPQGDGLRHRPLHPAAILATWSVAGLNARVYRVRNIGFHLVSVALVYTLGVMLLGARAPAAAAAVLFGVHPFANQAINGAVWTNTMAYALALGGVVLALHGLGAPVRGRRALALGGACALVCALVYEPTIALLALPWIAILLGCRVRPGRARWLAGAQLVVVVAACGVLRLVALPTSYEVAAASQPPLAIFVRNLALSLGAPLLPVDPVLASAVAGTPLPSEIDAARVVALARAAIGPFVVALVAAALALWWPRRRRVRAPDERARAHDGARVAILALAGAALPLALTFAVTDHPSETYLYGPCAFLALAVVAALWSRSGHRHSRWCVAAVLVLAASFVAATTVRNQRVLACGRTAARVLATLPASARTATVPVVFANTAAEPRTVRYGLYGYRGIHTIGHGAMADRGVSAALQLWSGDWRRSAVVVEAPTRSALCAGGAPGALRVWVHPDGRCERCAE